MPIDGKVADADRPDASDVGHGPQHATVPAYSVRMHRRVRFEVMCYELLPPESREPRRDQRGPPGALPAAPSRHRDRCPARRRCRLGRRRDPAGSREFPVVPPPLAPGDARTLVIVQPTPVFHDRTAAREMPWDEVEVLVPNDSEARALLPGPRVAASPKDLAEALARESGVQTVW